MRALVIAALLPFTACKKSDDRPTGKLCFAPNPIELFKWEHELDGAKETVDFTQGKPLAFRFRGETIAIPNAQRGFADVKEGEVVAVVRGDASVESWKVSWKLGNDLCYLFRTYDKEKPQRRPGFILNVNLPEDRCTCY